MKGFLAFLVVSAVIHTGVMIGLPDQGSPEGQGAEGGDILSLSPAAASDAALASAWDTPPETSIQPLALAQPTFAPDMPEISPDIAVQRPMAPPSPDLSLESAPEIATAAIAAPRAPDSAISQTPALRLPSLPDTPAHPAAPEMPRPIAATPSLSAPRMDTARPLPNTAPHFEGATALAAATSPRPSPRPENLAPEAAPEPDPEPARQPPRQPSASAPARVASGAGGGVSQGAAATPAPQPATSPAQIQSALAAWGGQIQSRIARARPNVRAAGRAVVQLSVSRGGQLVGLGLARSSGNPTVDQAALDAVRRAGRFPAAPATLTEASYTFSVPLAFQ